MQRWIIAASVPLVFAHANAVWSLSYPDRPLWLVVPFPPGGNVDSLATDLN